MEEEPIGAGHGGEQGGWFTDQIGPLAETILLLEIALAIPVEDAWAATAATGNQEVFKTIQVQVCPDDSRSGCAELSMEQWLPDEIVEGLVRNVPLVQLANRNRPFPSPRNS